MAAYDPADPPHIKVPMKTPPTQRFTVKRTVLDARSMRRIVRRMAGEIVEHEGDLDKLLLIGIRTRGLPLAERLAEAIKVMEGVDVEIGALDITFYRDDLSTIGPQPVVKGSDLPVDIEERTLLLCDDVLYTGRTVRAALDALNDYGRPSIVRLAVLVDRGHRELPIQADVVGKTLSTQRSESVAVLFEETDGEDAVKLLDRRPAEASAGEPTS